MRYDFDSVVFSHQLMNETNDNNQSLLRVDGSLHIFASKDCKAQTKSINKTVNALALTYQMGPNAFAILFAVDAFLNSKDAINDAKTLEEIKNLVGAILDIFQDGAEIDSLEQNAPSTTTRQ